MNKPHFLLKCVFCFLIVSLFLMSCQSETSNTPKGFQIHPDFKLELVASEPLIFDPVEMKFDENLRTYVLEMPGYPLRDAESRLVELIDTDNDGSYDKRLVMDENLGVASSFMPYKEGFLVASPPHLLFIKDTNADGKIDQRQKLIGGFSNENLQHNFNGLTYGLDNWIYAANGGNSGKPFFEDRPDSLIDIRGSDLRFDLDNKKMAKVGRSSGGFKLTFDNWGHLFETHNLTHVSHLVFEDRYLNDISSTPSRTLVNISDHEENGTSRIYPIGAQETRVNHPEQSGYFSGACGITHYGGGAFPIDFNNNILVADCVLNLVHFDMLSSEGSAFKTSRSREKVEFLASSDRSFRPVNMTVGPDGSLYVLDIHREVIEHPEWIPNEMEEKMDLNAGKDQGRIYRIVPKENWSPISSDFNMDDIEGLVSSLGSKNQWTRTTAQRLLVTNNRQEAIPLLEAQFENSKDDLARLHSLWTLEGLGKLKTSILEKALHDLSSGVRENAIKMTESKMNNEIELVDELIVLVNDDNQRVGMQATLSLGTLNPENYDDRSEAIASAISKTVSGSVLDYWATIAIATALQPQAFDFAQKLLFENKNQLSEKSVELLAMLSEKIAKDRNAVGLTALINDMKRTEVPPEIKATLIESFANGLQKSEGQNWSLSDKRNLTIALNGIESEEEVSLIKATGSLRKIAGLPVSPKISGMMRIAVNSIFDLELSVEKRLEQLRLLELDDFKNRAELLYRLLDNNQPLALQKEALSQLSDSDNRTVGKKLLELWPGLGPQARKKATDVLLYKSYNHDILLTAMENNTVNLGEFNLDLERRRTLLMWSEKDIQERAKKLFSDAGVVKRKDAIDNMRPALAMDGNVTSGAAVFNTLCAQCHRYGDQGKEVGPVLTEVNRKSKESLLYDILDPNAGVDTKYLNHQVKTTDGNIFTGLVFLETDKEIGLKMMGGDEKVLLKSTIESFSSLGTSMMFEGLEANMNHQEMADLLAFLQQ